MTCFRRLPLLFFVLLLLPLCACTAGNQDTNARNEAVRNTASEVENPSESNGAVSPVTEGMAEILDTTPAVQHYQQTATTGERFNFKGYVISESWRGVDIDENCQANNNNPPKADFPDPSICELDNFKLFLDRFSEDYDFQISVTKFPLKRTGIIPPWDPDFNGDELTKIECLNLPNNSKTRPLFPVKEEREQEKLTFSYVLEGPVATVHLGIEDTGYLVYYIFTWDQCWMLSEIKDYSM